LNAVLAAKRLLARGLASDVAGRAVLGTFGSDRVPSRGLRLDLTQDDLPPKVAASLAFRLYESAELRAVTARIKAEHRTVVELGASIGVVAAHALQQMSPEGRYVAVEANGALLPTLTRRLRQHAKGQQLTPIHAALSYAGEYAHFETSESHLASRATMQPTGERVRALTLSDIVAVHVPDPEPYGLICDIEGEEFRLLAKDGAALERCSLMIAELHEGDWGTIPDALRMLTDLGFTRVELDGHVVSASR
jgi:FkbM family methyltransferase